MLTMGFQVPYLRGGFKTHGLAYDRVWWDCNTKVGEMVADQKTAGRRPGKLQAIHDKF